MLGRMTGCVRFIVVSSILLVACGGSDKPAETPAGPTTATPSSTAASDTAPASATPAEAPAAAQPSAPSGPWPFSAQSSDDRKAQLERLAKDAGPIRTNWTPPGKGDRYGRAEGLIKAPVDKVKAKLQ